MGVIQSTPATVTAARRALDAADAGGALRVGDHALPPRVDEVVRQVLELLADGKAAGYTVSVFVPDAERPKCGACGEPIELADPTDRESWIHAEDANYFGDHSAWLDQR